MHDITICNQNIGVLNDNYGARPRTYWNIFTGNGKIAAPVPTLHIPDTEHRENKSKAWIINIIDALGGLDYTKKMSEGAGDYILANKIIFGTKDDKGNWTHKIIEWTYDSDSNCASTSHDSGVASNVKAPSAFIKKGVGNILNFKYEFTGDAPNILGFNMK